jgi:hypothetical protein
VARGISFFAMRRCAQCWKTKRDREFVGARGGTVRSCAGCRLKYGNWSVKTVEERLAAAPRRDDPRPTGRVIFVRKSHNRKLGPIPLSVSEPGTCPTSCGLYQTGCYASYGKLGVHWRGRSRANWVSWRKFLALVRELPEGTLWRHNEAGDLAGEPDGRIDGESLGALVEANRGRRGFTFTHRTDPENWELLRWANLEGFTVNLSADTPREADRLMMDGDPGVGLAGPVAVLLPADYPDRGGRTPAGHRVVVCPAQTSGLTCLECRLCANPYRHSIVGFRSHGQAKNLIPEIVRRKRTEPGFRPAEVGP